MRTIPAYIEVNGRPLCSVGVGWADHFSNKIGEPLICGHRSIASANRMASKLRRHISRVTIKKGRCPQAEQRK